MKKMTKLEASILRHLAQFRNFTPTTVAERRALFSLKRRGYVTFEETT